MAKSIKDAKVVKEEKSNKKTTKFCMYCGAEINLQAIYCIKCGRQLIYNNNYCKNCGSKILPGVKFCTNCGIKFGE